MDNKNRVVITGMGAVTPIGEDVNSSWESIISKRHNFVKCEFDNPLIKSRFFSFLPDNPKRHQHLPKNLTRAMSSCGKNALEAIRQAFEQAFGQKTSPTEYYDPYDCGAILGSGWGGLDHAIEFGQQYCQSKLSHPMSNLITMPSSMTAACSIMYGLKGHQNTLMAACAAGTIAIGEAYEAIRSGRAKCMVAGGSESLKEEFSIWSIDVLNALSKEPSDVDKACCPFDVNRSGFVLAEGAAVVCLEDYESAVKRGAMILAEVKGYAHFSDAFSLTKPSDCIEPRALSMMKAIEQANLTPNDIDYINAHGTSTTLNDLQETQAIKVAFGKSAQQVPISSTKSYTGHLIGAAGSFETIVCVKAMQDNCLPATLNLNEPDAKCNLNYLPNQHKRNTNAKACLNTSAGFGGHNASLVLAKTL